MQFLSGILGAVIGGLIVAWFNYQYLWKSQKKLEQMRTVFDDAMDALEADQEFLLKGDVFTKDVIETWIEYKQIHEVDAVRLRPHPHETGSSRIHVNTNKT